MAEIQSPLASKGRITFEPVASASESRKILSECARLTAAAQIFSRKQQLVLPSRFVRIDDRAREVGFRPDDFSGVRPFLEELASTRSPDCFVSLVNDRVRVLFRSPIKSVRDGILTLVMPDGVFRVQRREFLRLKIPPSHLLRAEILLHETDLQPRRQKVMDISAGGMALLVAPSEAGLYSVGQSFARLRFTIEKHTVLCRGVIKHIRPGAIEGEKIFIAGVLFTDLLPSDQRWISDYVNRENRELLRRMRF